MIHEYRDQLQHLPGKDFDSSGVPLDGISTTTPLQTSSSCDELTLLEMAFKTAEGIHSAGTPTISIFSFHSLVTKVGSAMVIGSQLLRHGSRVETSGLWAICGLWQSGPCNLRCNRTKDIERLVQYQTRAAPIHTDRISNEVI